MKYLTCTMFIGCLLIASVAYAQRPEHTDKRHFVPVPREVVLPVIVFQPSSPLQFEKVEQLMSIDGRGGHISQLRNRGTKAIRRFTVSYTFGVGTGGSWELGGPSDQLILPGQLAPTPPRDEAATVIPLTDQLREKLELRGPMQTIVFYMVERVEFADGTTFTDEAAAKALKSYLDDIEEKVYRGSQQPAEITPP